MDNNQATTQHCANCAKPALHLCPRCAHGLNIHGQERKLYYCGKNCQAAHWAAGHKVECKVTRDRRQLHRVSSLLQWAFYGTREAAWYDEVKAVDREGGGDSANLVVQLGKNKNSARFSAFPVKLFPQVHEKQAVLVHGAGRTAVIGMAECLISLLKGIQPSPTIEEVVLHSKALRHVRFTSQEFPVGGTHETHMVFRVTFKDGSAYAIDLCNAQYRMTTALEHGHAMFPWDGYLERLSVDEDNIESITSAPSAVLALINYQITSERLEAMRAGKYVRDDVHTATNMLIASDYEKAAVDWESACGTSMLKLLGLPQENYDSIIKRIKLHQQKRFEEMRRLLDDGRMTIVLRYMITKSATAAVLAHLESEQ